MQFLDFVQDTCPCFPDESTVNLETWNKVEYGLRVRYMGEGLECMPIFIFDLWSMTKYCLDLLPYIKKDFTSRYLSRDVGLTPYNQ
jgi:hypothetical protein